ncbi:hypothetical protein CVU37_14180 [candidate division BRC1 bacterium HGW-BRC1-1]|jgi:predicted Ser/Thr protein kinase|nr:MAG: hypothetical protein CVU37_14180 [candidate division BRC1 bacterium HGW-BRC1-1]
MTASNAEANGSWESFVRADLDAMRVKPLKMSLSIVGPDVWLLARDGCQYVLKDFRGRSFLLRQTWGRISIGRETRALSRLAGIVGVPRMMVQIDPYAFIMEFMEGETLPRSSQRGLLGPDFFPALESLIDQLHARGVAHGDLRRRNILVTTDKRPALLDFETAVLKKDCWFGCRFFKMMTRVDKLKVLKMKHKYFSLQTSAEDRALLENPPWNLKAGHFLRHSVYGKWKRWMRGGSKSQ